VVSIVLGILRLLETLTHDEAQQHIDKVTSDMKFDKSRIGLSNETHEFELNGKKMVAAGLAYRDSAKVDMFPHVGGISHENIRGIIAHEIGHQKFNDAIKKASADREAMRKDPGPAPDPNHPYHWGRKGGVSAMMTPDGSMRGEYAKKYAHSQAIYHAYEKHHPDNFAAGDGVSPYSREYWHGYKNGTVGGHTAVHETLAEMHRLKYETGKLHSDQHLGNFFGFSIYLRSGEKPVSRAQHAKHVALWRNLYDTLDKIHQREVYKIKVPQARVDVD
jgi:hypothetical protein